MRKIILSIPVLMGTLFCVNQINAQDKKIPPLPPPKVELSKFSPPDKEFLEMNPTIKNVWWEYKGGKATNRLNVNLKDGRKEKYNLNDEEVKKSFLDKYGRLPIN